MVERPSKRLPLLQDAPAEAPRSVMDRRRFLSITAASLALAKVGCSRQPAEHIVPYVRQPEEAPPGTSQYYATSMVQEGYATGLLARSVTGRPIKVEGNPEHPASLGATDSFAQAATLSLYNPDRAQVITRLDRISTWSRFAAEIAQVAEEERAAGGAGIRILTEAVTSPTLAAEIGAFLLEFPGAAWSRFEPAGAHQTRAGLAAAFGAPLDARYDLLAADVIVTFDCDLLAAAPGSLRYARDFARRRHVGATGALGHASARRGELPASPRMNRLYSVESSPTCTGTLADHRLVLRPGDVAAFAAALAAEVGAVPEGGAAPPISPDLARWVAAVASDLRTSNGRALVVAGEPCPPAVHVLAAAMNEALGAAGRTVFYTAAVEAEPIDHVASIQQLAADMHAGRVRLLLILEGNPVYTAPADLDFARALRRVPLAAHLSDLRDETAAHCHYHLPAAHFLEAWGDARAFDGTASLIQPLIEPFFGGKTPLEVVAALRGRPAVTGRDLVRAHWQAELGTEGFEDTWRRALELGFVEYTSYPARAVAVAPAAAAAALAEVAAHRLEAGALEIAFRPDPTVGDGRYADNAWLQELPKPQTKQTWGNAAWMSPDTAAVHGLAKGDLVQIVLEGRSVTALVLPVAGHADGTITLHLGYGRTAGGHVGRGLGFDAYSMRTTRSLWRGGAALLRKVGEGHELAITQGDFDPHGRPIARVAGMEEYLQNPWIVGAMAHVPGPEASLLPAWPQEGRQWGMSIDQNICTGCSSCVVACQAENNIPVVGREGVLMSREMHWLRIDRYEVPWGAERVVVNQPMACVHCETAPCEYVCPVQATSHSAEGLNEMTYNRCVGTRYCQNNCPYKVRRFNFFDMHKGEGRSLRMLRNPDVTVRSRGVMEKCTYCVQRISAGRIAAEIEGRPVRDGEIVTACQAACPTGAIVFGDIRDPAARVTRLKQDPRSYGVLAELGTRPRTTHLARIQNPNPEISRHG